MASIHEDCAMKWLAPFNPEEHFREPASVALLNKALTHQIKKLVDCETLLAYLKRDKRIEHDIYTVDGLHLDVELMPANITVHGQHSKIMVANPGNFGKYLVHAFMKSGFGALDGHVEDTTDTCVLNLNYSRGNDGTWFPTSESQHAKYCLVSGISPAFLHKVAHSTIDTESFSFWYRLAKYAEHFDKVIQRTMGEGVLRSSIDTRRDKALENRISQELMPLQLQATKNKFRETVAKINAAGAGAGVDVKLDVEKKHSAEETPAPSHAVLAFSGGPAAAGVGQGPKVTEGAGAVQAGVDVSAALNAVPSAEAFNTVYKHLGDLYATLSPTQKSELFKALQDLDNRFTTKLSAGPNAGH